jgi:hypothetical protein
VIGFSTLYTYEGDRNENPILNGIEFGGLDTSQSCSVDADCSLADNAAPELGAGCGAEGTCVPRIAPCTHDDCPKYSVSPDVDRASAERVAGARPEVIWANFYSDAGSFGASTKLVDDDSLGWIAAHTSNFTAPRREGIANVWVTVNDQRGGAAWKHIEVLVASP